MLVGPWVESHIMSSHLISSHLISSITTSRDVFCQWSRKTESGRHQSLAGRRVVDRRRLDLGRRAPPRHQAKRTLELCRCSARRAEIRCPLLGPEPQKGCVVEKIKEFQAVLRAPAKTADEKRFALRFLAHLIQDLHMPLHVGDNRDRGGNDTQVRFFDRGSDTRLAGFPGINPSGALCRYRWRADWTVLLSLYSGTGIVVAWA